MDLLPAAFFLMPGAFAVVAQRFASAQQLTSATQLLLAIVYSGVTYITLSSPLGNPIRTAQFPSALFDTDHIPLAQAEVAWRLFVISLVAGGVGLGVGRALMSRRIHWAAARMTGRNLFASVWSETFHDASRQWIRLQSETQQIVGWLESASDDPSERALLLSNVYVLDGSRPRRVVGHMAFVDTGAFPIIVLLGRDVGKALIDARHSQPLASQPRTSPRPAGRP